MTALSRDTIALNAGLPEPSEPGPFMAGPQFSATYVAPGEPAAHPLTYGRFHNPTWTAWEKALATLEGGDALAFSSGMAATAAVFGATLTAGDVVVLPEESYYTTRRLAADWFGPLGVEVRLGPTRGNRQGDLLEGARLLWLETPSNPTLDLCDITLLVEKARAVGTLVAVDNTTATAFLQQPLALGATFSVASDTKALTGHADLLLGHVATRDPALLERLRTYRTQFGSIPGPMEVWLAHRALGTVGVRLERQCANALRLAGALARHRMVKAVHYPGLPTHPDHALGQRQMSAAGCVLSFDLGDRPAAERFLSSLRLVREATSFGGIHTTAERRARWGGDKVSEGFIRMSAGCEAGDDLVADLSQALEVIGR